MAGHRSIRGHREVEYSEYTPPLLTLSGVRGSAQLCVLFLLASFTSVQMRCYYHAYFIGVLVNTSCFSSLRLVEEPKTDQGARLAPFYFPTEPSPWFCCIDEPSQSLTLTGPGEELTITRCFQSPDGMEGEGIALSRPEGGSFP